MFAYCGNNPANRADPTGNAFVQIGFNYTDTSDLLFPALGGSSGGSIVVSGNIFVLAVKDSPNKDISGIYDLIESACNIDDLSDILVTIQHLRDYIDNNDTIQNINALDDIDSGYADMKKGFKIFLAPAPTLLDEIIGAVKVAKGFYKIVMGVGELFDWTEADD